MINQKEKREARAIFIRSITECAFSDDADRWKLRYVYSAPPNPRLISGAMSEPHLMDSISRQLTCITNKGLRLHEWQHEASRWPVDSSGPTKERTPCTTVVAEEGIGRKRDEVYRPDLAGICNLIRCKHLASPFSLVVFSLIGMIVAAEGGQGRGCQGAKLICI